MHPIEKLEAELAEAYHYKPIPPLFAEKYRNLYISAIPHQLSLIGNPHTTLCDLRGMPICNGYTRVVVGDYGPFVEFTGEQAHTENFSIAPGQRYRLSDERFSEHIKYVWYTTKNRSGVKLYFQKRAVLYADYKPGLWYVSPFCVQIFDKGGNE